MLFFPSQNRYQRSWDAETTEQLFTRNHLLFVDAQLDRFNKKSLHWLDSGHQSSHFMLSSMLKSNPSQPRLCLFGLRRSVITLRRSRNQPCVLSSSHAIRFDCDNEGHFRRTFHKHWSLAWNIILRFVDLISWIFWLPIFLLYCFCRISTNVLLLW